MLIEYICLGYVAFCLLGWLSVPFYKMYKKSDLYYIREAKKLSRDTIETLLYISYKDFKHVVDTWCIINNKLVVDGKLVDNNCL